MQALTVDYGRARAVHGVSLDVGAGEAVALLGANGAGKSSTLLAISGIVPAHGRMIFDGHDILGAGPHDIVARGLVQVPESRAIYPGLTVEENLMVAAYTRRRDPTLADDRALVASTLPRLNDLAKRTAGTLSGGEQQMLSIAKALLAHPRLLLVDELSLGLSPKVTQELFAVLAAIKQRGTAILLVEQFVPLALGLADRAYVLEKGRVAASATAGELAGASSRLQASYLGGGTEAAVLT
ncbi:MAG: ABC transporter ATP-binding protein [Actinomycetota bacterium]